MRRWLIGFAVLLVIGAVGGGIWYLATGPEDARPETAKRAEFFLPENPRLLVRFNHSRESLRSLNEVSMVERFRNSRFESALNNRILPLLSLVSDQVRANTPYPSQQLLRYFRDSVSYLVQTQGGQPVFLMTPSDARDDTGSRNLRTLVEEWIVSPARNRSAWTVKQRMVRDNPLWELTYSFPDRDLTISFHLATVHNHGLLSLSSRALTESIEGYYRRDQPSYELSKTNDGTLVDFFVAHDTPDTTSSLLANSRGTIQPGSAKRLQGAVTVRPPYVTLNARAAFPDTVPVANIDLPRDLLAYVPPETYALNVLAVPSFNEKTPEEYRRLLQHRGQSLLAGRQSLMRLLGSLEGLELLQHQDVLGFASFYSEDDTNSEQSFLLILKPSSPKALETQLDPYRRSGGSEPGAIRRYEFGPVQAKGLRHGEYLLLSGSAEVLREARERQQNREGFVSHENFQRIENRVPETLTSFSYFSTSPLTSVLRDGEPIQNARYQLAKTFLGFDPMEEVGTLVEGVPPNFMVTRRETNRNVSLSFYTAGDVFLPLALQRLNPEYRPDLGGLPQGFEGVLNR